jgi:hypothetical protein
MMHYVWLHLGNHGGIHWLVWERRKGLLLSMPHTQLWMLNLINPSQPYDAGTLICNV